MTRVDGGVRLAVGDRTVDLDDGDARRLRDRLTDAVAGRRVFRHTVGHTRPDGSYVVARRGADSAGHRKVFARFGELRALYDDLPDRFRATDVTVDGVTGNRRHLLVRHVAEHPAFDCELVARQPLTAAKGE